MNNIYQFELGTDKDIDELGQLYDDINDYLMKGNNYPGWIKGLYPVRETAAIAVREQNLYVIRINNRIAGTVILRHEPESGYQKANWIYQGDYSNIFVIYTFAVHPDYLNQGVGTAILQQIDELAAMKGIKSIRLDVYDKNLPAIRLYEKCGFENIVTVDLGYGKYGLDLFVLYEKLI